MSPLVELALDSRWAYFSVCYVVSVLSLTFWYYAVVYAFGFDSTPNEAFGDKERSLRIAQSKQRSWVLTGTAAFIMTIASIPFNYDLLRHGLDPRYVQRREALARAVVAFFVAYLNTVSSFALKLTGGRDSRGLRFVEANRSLLCLLATRHNIPTALAFLKKSRISSLEAYVTVNKSPCLPVGSITSPTPSCSALRDICHIFCGAAMMEVSHDLRDAFRGDSDLTPDLRPQLPTAVFALSMLVPRTRSDLVFTSLFFLTRILYHVILIAVYASKHGVAYSSGLDIVDPTYIPLVGVILAAPLHVLWFSSALVGMLKRSKKARSVAMVPATATSAVDQSRTSITDATKAEALTASKVVAQRLKLVSLASSYLSSPRPFLHVRTPLPNPIASTRPLPSPSRRHLEQEVRDFFLQARRDLLPLGAQNWLQRDENDILKAQVLGPSLNLVRLQAGRLSATGRADVRRFGGKVRRSLLEGSGLPLGLGRGVRRATETA
ncbi:BQ5605_C005g03597 [Microbotryum silenes-dioicae]|uniref:BQ5605_C005g03597 protein n=1 Tax=Microbotryum silenes-dioicae TaxID=796604 RepID=A0A2X0PDF0_9BASI|nr:BQ5605_C005g03597 [Microbotryum silenes-dioicae]